MPDSLQGNHDSFQLIAETKEEMALWMETLKAIVDRLYLYEHLLLKRNSHKSK